MDDLLKSRTKSTSKLNITSELKKFNLDVAKQKSSKESSIDGGIGYDDLASLYDVSQAVNSTLILDDILALVMTRAIRLLNAERGFLMLLDENNKLQFKTAHNIRKEQLDSEDMKISTTVADMVVKTGEAVYTSDAQIDDRFSQKASIIDLNIRSAMCVPLMIQQKTIGVLYLDNSSQANIFLKQDLKLFEMFAAQAAAAIYNARLYTEVLELQRYQENILKNTPVGIIVVNCDESITTANEISLEIFSKVGWLEKGADQNSLLKKKLEDTVPGENYKLLGPALKSAAKEPVEVSRLSVRNNDNEFVLRIKVCPFESFDNKPNGHIIMIEDISEQVVMEQYLILSEKFIAKGEMAAAIGHELNNYLTAISTNAQLLAMNIDKGDQAKANTKVDIIIENVDHIKRFTDGLMDFSSLESKPVNFDLKKLIDDVMFFVHPQHAFKQVAIELDIPDHLPPVFMDVGQVHQVILNIFINAADAFEEFTDGIGTIAVTVKSLESDGAVQINISDNGPGINEDIIDKIFEPHITSKKDGHGFGLWTCQRIIENHGGSVKASNSSEGGAVFEIVLPVSRN